MTLLRIFACLGFAAVVAFGQASPSKGSARKKVTFTAKDGLEITADLYAATSKSAPFILLCHQAGSSRGEYRKIAPRLVKAGYNCLAIDQRSGRGGNRVASNVVNETALRAKKAGLPQDYLSARQDVEAGLDWASAHGFTGKKVLWGSSYSSSLTLLIAPDRKDLAAALAFSPGEYFRGKPGLVTKAVKRLTIPVMVVSPMKERESSKPLFEACASENKVYLTGPGILHGSRTLVWPENPERTWKDVMNFLGLYVPTDARPSSAGKK